MCVGGQVVVARSDDSVVTRSDRHPSIVVAQNETSVLSVVTRSDRRFTKEGRGGVKGY